MSRADSHLVDKHLVQPHGSKRGLDDVGDCCRRGNVLCSDVLQTQERGRPNQGAGKVCTRRARLPAVSIDVPGRVC